MIYPKFVPNSFWNYSEACELVGAKYPAAPLGLITVAAMLRSIGTSVLPSRHDRRHAQPAA
jgi:hypothetical protein